MISVNIPDPLAQDAVIQAKVFNRTVDNQISYWAKIGKIAEENPDLSFDFIINPAWTFGVFIPDPSARAAERGRWAS